MSSGSDGDDSSAQGEEIYDVPSTRDLLLKDIDGCDKVEDAQAIARALLDMVLRTSLAPPLKEVISKKLVEIRVFKPATEEEDPELRSEIFEPLSDLRIMKLQEKFELDGLAEKGWPWLEAVEWDDAPFSETPAVPPLIIFPNGLPPKRNADGELKEHVETPFEFDLSKSGGRSYYLRTGCSCRGKLFAGLRSISKPVEHTGDTDEEAEKAEREAAAGSLALSSGALQSLEDG
jgi:hypothetical protein